jgi:hemerythrin HHE cation binding domain-containing protein
MRKPGSSSARQPYEPGPVSPAFVGVFKTLAEQHREAAALLKLVHVDPGQRAALWPTVRQALISHEHSEVRELYPVLRQDRQTRALADRHDREARDLDAIIGRLDRMPIQSELWSTLFDQLAQTVLAHVAEEEAEIFPAAQQALGQARAQQLDVTARAARRKLMDLV